LAAVERATVSKAKNSETLGEIRMLAYAARGQSAPPRSVPESTPAPRLSEPWFCCSEPSRRQLRQISGY
ncbi:MAG TPA: hypothetical protein VGJ84_12575, partial [Polyangiaceae bacterium]|jgi:hypothetical protein